MHICSSTHARRLGHNLSHMCGGQQSRAATQLYDGNVAHFSTGLSMTLRIPFVFVFFGSEETELYTNSHTHTHTWPHITTLFIVVLMVVLCTSPRARTSCAHSTYMAQVDAPTILRAQRTIRNMFHASSQHRVTRIAGLASVCAHIGGL